MDFIKKHYEKIVLAASLLVLIGSAVLLALRVGALSTEIQTGTRNPRPKPEPVKPIDLGEYSNAIASLKTPALWTNNPVTMFPSVTRTQLEETTTVVMTNATGPKVGLVRITHRQFKLRFDAYAGKGENFQLNFQFRPRTFFVPAVGMPVGDQFEDTGYILAKFEQKTCRETVPGLGDQDVDCSVVTLKRGNENPILLVLNKPTEEQEPVAMIQCGADPHPREVRRGLEFTCESVTYKVVDIDSDQVIIIEKQTGEKHTISLTAPKE